MSTRTTRPTRGPRACARTKGLIKRDRAFAVKDKTRLAEERNVQPGSGDALVFLGYVAYVRTWTGFFDHTGVTASVKRGRRFAIREGWQPPLSSDLSGLSPSQD